MRMPWQLLRNPLSPGVPLEGSDTVQGLRTLERRRMTEMLQQPAGGATAGAAAAAGGGVGGWQRRFQRYRGPFVEQLSTEDLKQAPKNWTVFWKGSEGGQLAQAYNLPASLDVLHERTEENFVTFLPNYLRVAAAVVLATFYLRPRALLGAAAVVYSMYRSLGRVLQRQQAEAAAATEGRGGTRPPRAGGVGAAGGRAASAADAAAAAGGAPGDPNEQMVTAGLTVVTWLLVAYTRCLPVLLLGAVVALVAVLVHCGLRRAPSEYRHRGRQLLGFTWRQVLGREPVPDGSPQPTALFREVAAAGVQAARRRCQLARRYCHYYWLSVLDVLRRPRALRSSRATARM